MKYRSIKGGLAVLLALLFILTPYNRAYAHDAYFFQVLIDENQLNYQGNVLEDNLSWYSDLESSHLEAGFGDFTKLNGNPYISVGANKDDYEAGEVGDESKPFTFPPQELGGGWSGQAKNDAGRADIDRAFTIKETLMPGLNDALRILNNGEDFKDIKELIYMSNQLSGAIPSGRVNGWTIEQRRASYSDPKEDLKNGIMNEDYLTISKRNSKGELEEYEFVFQMQKGYKAKGKWENNLYNEDYKYAEDAEYITWNMIMYQGVYGFFAKGYTAKDASKVTKPNQLEEVVVQMMGSFVNGVRNLLGLYSMNELIYNDGIRGSKMYHYGAMPMKWEENVMLYHFIFQAIAWSLISLAIVKTLIQRNISTINPSMRVSLIGSIQDLMLTGLILAFVMPLINMLLMFNLKLVNIFGAVAPDLDNMTGMNNYSNALAGVVIQGCYLMISIYLNFVYIVRSLTIAILTAMAPLFVVTIALGGRWKALFGMWMKELTSNIFLQSFHAFIFAFFYVAQSSSRGIEMLVICMAVMPLTKFFRGMIMGQAGGIADEVGMATMKAGVGMVGGAVKSATTKSKNAQGSGSNAGNGTANGNANANASSDIKMGSSERFQQNQQNQRVQSSGSAGNGQMTSTHAQDMQATYANREIPADVFERNNPAEMKQYQGEMSTMSGRDAVKTDGKLNRASNVASLGKAGATAVMGAGKVALGAGAGIALGSIDPSLAREAGHLVGSGLKDMKTSGSSVANLAPVKNVTDKVSGAVSKVMSGKAPTTGGTDATDVNTGGALMNHEAYARMTNNNGDYEVYRGADVLSQQGVVNASTDNNQNVKYTFDRDKLNAVDQGNLDRYYQAFAGGNKDEIQHLRNQGVENVSRMNGTGHYAVTYNQVGKEKLGVRSVRQMGDSHFVEQKYASDPRTTKLTFTTTPLPSQPASPPPQARESKVLNSEGNPIIVQPTNQATQTPQAPPTVGASRLQGNQSTPIAN